MSLLMICKYTGGYIYKVTPGEFPFAATCFEKEETQKKLLFIEMNNRIALAARWSIKYKAGRKTRRRRITQANAKR